MAEAEAGRARRLAQAAGRAGTGTARRAAGAGSGLAAAAKNTEEQAASAANTAANTAAEQAANEQKGAGGRAIGAAKGAAGGLAGAAKGTTRAVAGVAKEAGQEIVKNLPTDRLKQEAQNLLHAAAGRALARAENKLEGLTGRLSDYAGGKGSSLLGAVTGSGGDKPGMVSGAIKGGLTGGLTGGLKGGLKGIMQKLTGKGGDKGNRKITNIIESIDIGAPRRLVYNQWTQFEDFPSFMKKVENVKRESDQESTWKAQVFWSHRNWKAHVVEQLPDQRIIWRSEGPKGFVNGAVTFHEITDDLTRVLVVLEYHPQGLFERTGNLWRAQGAARGWSSSTSGGM
ncbi:SRPBCC family protein [Nonomuraea thailandensis]